METPTYVIPHRIGSSEFTFLSNIMDSKSKSFMLSDPMLNAYNRIESILRNEMGSTTVRYQIEVDPQNKIYISLHLFEEEAANAFSQDLLNAYKALFYLAGIVRYRLWFPYEIFRNASFSTLIDICPPIEINPEDIVHRKNVEYIHEFICSIIHKKKIVNTVIINKKKYNTNSPQIVSVAGKWYLKTDPLIAKDEQNLIRECLKKYKMKYKQNRPQLLATSPGIVNASNPVVSTFSRANGWDPYEDVITAAFMAEKLYKEGKLVYQRKDTMIAVITGKTPNGRPIIKYSGTYFNEFMDFVPSKSKMYSLRYSQIVVLNYEVGRLNFIEDKRGNRFLASKEQEKSRESVMWRRKIDEYNSPFPDIYSNSTTHLKTEGKTYKFGLEIETCKGVLPLNVVLYKKLDLKCTFDGSLRMKPQEDINCGEYITGVLSGDSGLLHLSKIVYELAQRCEVNKKCSVHIHVSGMMITQEFTVNIYRLLQFLEGEIFSMMPPSRKKNEYCMPMQKITMNINYNSPSYKVEIREMYQEIIKIMQIDKKLTLGKGKKDNHPRGYHCNYDKTTPRYWWANFIPMLFNIRSNNVYTLEIRCHSGTLNYRKIENWILIVLGIIWFAENIPIKIHNKITLREVMFAAYPKMGNQIVNYIETRKKLFVSADSASNRELRDYKDCTNKKITSLKEIIQCAS